jgi:hypothetical protein
MYLSNQKIALTIIFVIACTFFVSCSRSTRKQEELKDTSDLHSPEAKLKKRAEELTQGLERQKAIKSTIPQMASIEKFERETS